jgi:hypothetical protein
VQPSVPSLQCEVCGARVLTLRRGRCWICYIRWAEARPVGAGSACAICNDRRRENLRLIEFHGNWIPMCHNCGSKALKLAPVPPTIDGIRQRLSRDRRWHDRRHGISDHRMLRKERRVGERRVEPDPHAPDWINADDLIIEIIEVPGEDDVASEATRISTAPLDADSHGRTL